MNAAQYYDFNGKTALITGASSGLGEQFARTLSENGCRVLLTARRIDKLKSIAKTLDNAEAIEMDVANPQAVKKVFADLEASGEKIDICVNNAGTLKRTPIFEECDESFEQVMQTNVMGVWYVTRAAARHMKNHSIPGSIINISSVGGDRCCRPNVSGYAASKAAVIKLTQNLVLELSPHNIRINAILPGILYTEMTKQRLDNKVDYDTIKQPIPLDAIGNTKDLDAALLYLASNTASSYTTGSCLSVDGGLGCGQSTVIKQT